MNIIITGGSRGIGRDAALCLSEDKDNRILITGRNEKALREVAGSASNENISWFTVDFSKNAGQMKFLIEHINSLFSIVDIMINNAGALVNKEFLELSDDENRLMMEVNYFVPSMLIRSLQPLMRKGSHILNISSMGGFQGSAKFSGLSGYSASKAALACLTECLANEFIQSGISVNCLAPGSVQTEMLEEAFPGYKAPVTSAEMGKFIAYFAVNGNRFFNGKILPVALSTP
jgi:NAD(P)-dependent dehydrogenase (short-subunit alcohol dehydrogenase family)